MKLTTLTWFLNSIYSLLPLYRSKNYVNAVKILKNTKKSHSGTKFRSVASINSFETNQTTKVLECMLFLRMGLYSPLFGHVEKGERFSPINEALFQRS